MLTKRSPGATRLFARRVYLDLKQEIDTLTLPQEEYEAIQHRPGVLEYVSPRVMIMSTLVWLIPLVEEHLAARDIAREDARVLDAGARDGWTVALFEQLGFARAQGVELVDQLVDHATAQGRNVQKGDIQQLSGLEDGAFDLVFCRHTLEHTMDPRRALCELIRVARPGGLIYVALPLERQAHGKHTTAIPNLRLLGKLADGEPVEVIKLMRSADTGAIIPDADEALLLLRKSG